MPYSSEPRHFLALGYHAVTLTFGYNVLQQPLPLQSADPVHNVEQQTTIMRTVLYIAIPRQHLPVERDLPLGMRRFCRNNFWHNRKAKAKSKMLA